MTDTAAVILMHGEHESYRMVLSDLLTQGIPEESICIVHNPTRRSDRRVAAPPGVEVIRMAGNAGYAAGMNAGIRRLLDRNAQWIWLLTHDVRLRAGAVSAMLTAADEGSEYGALGPRLLQSGTRIAFSLGGQRSRWGRPYNAGYGSRLDEHGAIGTTRPCIWLDGSSIMLRAQALREVGLYDTDLYFYSEDTDLCLRLERSGWSIGVVEEAIAEQMSGQLSRPGLATFLRTRNDLRYVRNVAGRVAVLHVVGEHAFESIRYMQTAIMGPQRRTAAIRCGAMWIGIVAFLGGRMGSPPAWLPGKGDAT